LVKEGEGEGGGSTNESVRKGYISVQKSQPVRDIPVQKSQSVRGVPVQKSQPVRDIPVQKSQSVGIFQYKRVSQ
jgi:hypothetical protein